MATTVPRVSQDVEEVNRVLDALELARKDKKSGGFAVKKTTFDVKSSEKGIKVDSWRLQDWDYKRRGLPTYARGLFTTKARGGTPEIAVRGYDKFFNIGEVRETAWDFIIAKTQAPYELTLKENGCIIFISGLEDGTLLVCSKHSTGDREGVEVSHAGAGEIRLDRQLAAIGKTRVDLARELRERNATAVVELCDDEFEEHVLAYGPEKAGLYLHGINLNLPNFVTYPGQAVQEFADQWGFRKTGLIVMNDVHQVKTFLEEAANTGAHEGRDIEGFVIRCKMSPNPDTRPYEDWFFKFKFEEPYLMYRQWRECTKALIANRQPKFKKHKIITAEYLQYARQRLASDPNLGQLYNQNHGIIALRDDFLKFRNLKGSEAANMDAGEPIAMPEVTGGVILCPIATLGCGKTTIGLALTHLFGWGHIQNDNISGKGRPPRFTKAVLDLLKQHPVAYADRNNAQRHERKQLIGDVKLQGSTAKIVCLYFRHDEESIEEIRRVARERVVARGDNHQTIRAATDEQKATQIMESFYQRFEPCDPDSLADGGFDVIIDLDPRASSRVNLETVVTQLHQYFPNLVKEVPCAEKLDAAFEAAMSYKPCFKHDIPDRTNKGPQRDQQRQQSQPQKKVKKKPLEYMSIDIPHGLVNTALEQAFQTSGAQVSSFFEQLKQTRRVQDKFHVTLMHRATSAAHPELWQHYVRLHEAGAGTDEGLGSCKLMLERAVFDDRIMAIVVRIIDEEGKWQCVNRVAHITVGTRDESVKPKESNDLLARWLEEGTSQGHVKEVIFEQKPVIQGHVRGVLAR
ncbi:hypothetical protein HIM_07264 [Hirsutella minnesotensis 3608]|uniref:tRNA ligase n=1 Tax=Hirsutella minnesotensis 3608 TaxID=1043627 RepID=A0A0F7ZN75_9HYPO|nr:hypothetical protein HIM_07264 [Hirsutella minnesotensis 3608]